MRPDEYPKEYNQQALSDDVAVINSTQISVLPATQIAYPPSPPEVCTFPNERNLTADMPHSHTCDYCGAALGCQREGCKPKSKQTCEQCDIPLIEAVFDGACEPKNPGGHVSYGSLVRVNGQVVYSNSCYVGHGPKMSNNVAEYCGAIDALAEAVKHKGIITLIGDSKLVIMQLGPDPALGRKQWKARNGLYLPHYKQAIRLVNQHRGRIRFQWVSRKENVDCDELSKTVLRDRGVAFCIQPERRITVEPRVADDKPWGGKFRNRRARKHAKHNQPKSRRSHSVIVQRTSAGREENAQ